MILAMFVCVLVLFVSLAAFARNLYVNMSVRPSEMKSPLISCAHIHEQNGMPEYKERTNKDPLGKEA